MLIWGTAWYVFISIWNVLVMLEYPEIMVLPSWMRVLPFGVCIAFLSYYIAGIATEIIKLSNDETWKDSVVEIFFAYVLWITTPAAITETMYIANMIMHSDDISISPDSEGPDDDDEDKNDSDDDDEDKN